MNNDSKRHIACILLAASACAQWPILHWSQASLPPALSAIPPGICVLGASFLLSWAAEAAEMDLPQGLSVTLLALIAVLPEYAVDIYFAWTAGKDPSYIGYATANMTGSNRLLIGLGWAAVLFAYFLRHGKKEIELNKSIAPEIITLGLATLYAFIIPLKGTLSLLDFAVFITLFALYAWRTAQAEVCEPELEGPAETIGSLQTSKRRAVVAGMFLYSALCIYIAAEPFAEGLLATGRSLHMDEFFMVQWLAPLASEAPEFIVAVIFALKGKAAVGLRVLLSSKVNQWTLLIGMLPAAYSLSSGNNAAMHLDARQCHEIFLTAAQSFFALAILSNLRFSIQEALALALLFITQPFFISATARNIYSAFYILAGIAVLIRYGVLAQIRTLAEGLRLPVKNC
ncbi:MAG: sodium:calcium antiporter [Elusimicrobiota bacterium]|jgi:cation:H+ antiporter